MRKLGLIPKRKKECCGFFLDELNTPFTKLFISPSENSADARDLSEKQPKMTSVLGKSLLTMFSLQLDIFPHRHEG